MKPNMYMGQRVGGEPTDPAENFYICQDCKQAVDRRDLFEVWHHMEEGHKPLPVQG